MSTPESLPAWARLAVRLFVPASIRPEIEGDLIEGFLRHRRASGEVRARMWLVGQVVRLRPAALRDVEPWRRGEGMMDGMGVGWVGDVRQTLRSFKTRFGFTATVVTTVALAIGATTSVFTVVNGVLLRPLEFEEPDRLVLAWQTRPEWRDSPNAQLASFAEQFPLSVPTFADWQDARTSFESMGIYSGHRWVLQGEEGAELIRGLVLTSGVFSALGAQPLMGRAMQPDDDAAGAPPVVVLSHGLWRDRFGADPDIIGKSLSFDDLPRVVIAVMPEEFTVPGAGGEAWASLVDEEERSARDSQSYTVLGRLREGATVESARADLFAVQERLGAEYPVIQGDMRARVEGLLEHMVGDVRATLLFLLGAVGLVLAIACVNIANMLSVNGLSRSRELAVKSALGASRGQLVRLLFTESILLAGVGGALGIVLAVLGLPMLLDLLPPSIPRATEIGVDGRVVLFGLFATLSTAALVGVLPALQAAGTAPKQTIDATSRGMAGGRIGHRVRSALVMTEMALAFLLLVGAGLLGTSFYRMWNVDRGFEPAGLVMMAAAPDPRAYPEREEQDQFARDLRERLEAIPGVEVTRTNQIPFGGSSSTTSFYLDGDDGEEIEARLMISVVDHGYFDVLGIERLEGRVFDRNDVADGPRVAVANEALARELWPDGSAIGKTMRDRPDAPMTTIVGVVRDVRHSTLTRPAQPKLYVAAAQDRRSATQWVIRAERDPAGIVEDVRQAVSAVSPSTPVRTVGVLQDRISDSVAVPRFRTAFVLGLAVLATILALLGVYGVVSFVVSQRSKELAVRMAIGARPSEVVLRTIRGGLQLAFFGVLIGSLIAWRVSALLEEFLYDVEPVSLGAYGAVGATIALVAVLASWLPARRAARVDPVTVLKAD